MAGANGISSGPHQVDESRHVSTASTPPRHMPRWSDVSPLISVHRPELSPTRRRLANAVDISDLRAIARRRCPTAVFDYVDGAASDEISLRRARQLYADLEFNPSVLRDVSDVDATTSVLGSRSAQPFAFAPTGFTRLMNHEGEGAVARVAQRHGIPYALSTMGTTSIEEVAAAAPKARKWFQLYIWRDRAAGADLVARAQQMGYEALILTVDVPVAGPRLRDSAEAEGEDGTERARSSGMVVQPAHDRAAHVRLAQLVERNYRRADRPAVRPDDDDRRPRMAAVI